jgi:hypothetical protein
MKKQVLIAFAIGLCLTANVFLPGQVMAQVPGYVPTNGLVGYWPFNGNANDESGNANNGTVNGATLTTDRFGVANKAYSFDGVDDHIRVVNFNLQATNNFSVSLWVNIIPSGNYQVFLSKGPKIPGHFEIYSFAGTNRLSWNTFDMCQNIESNFSIFNQVQHHIVIVQSNDIIKFYVDNAPQGQFPCTGNLQNVINDLTFGKVDDLFPYFTNGKLDDIGIWNRALTSQEINDLYNSTICSNDLTISPIVNSIQTGNTANFYATTSDANSTFIWQSDFGQGFQTLNNVGNYSGTNTNNLTISNVQLSNHNQPFRIIANAGNCTDTSNIATIQIADTCITNVTIYDTLLTTVTDTLIINTTLSLPAPNNENTILIYPNPASDHITIDNGNFAAMAGYSIKIENNAGQQVFQNTINQAQFYVDLSTWTGNGLYFVHLIDAQGNTVTVRKIVLQ